MESLAIVPADKSGILETLFQRASGGSGECSAEGVVKLMLDAGATDDREVAQDAINTTMTLVPGETLSMHWFPAAVGDAFRRVVCPYETASRARLVVMKKYLLPLATSGLQQASDAQPHHSLGSPGAAAFPRAPGSARGITTDEAKTGLAEGSPRGIERVAYPSVSSSDGSAGSQPAHGAASIGMEDGGVEGGSHGSLSLADLRKEQDRRQKSRRRLQAQLRERKQREQDQRRAAQGQPPARPLGAVAPRDGGGGGIAPGGPVPRALQLSRSAARAEPEAPRSLMSPGSRAIVRRMQRRRQQDARREHSEAGIGPGMGGPPLAGSGLQSSHLQTGRTHPRVPRAPSLPRVAREGEALAQRAKAATRAAAIAADRDRLAASAGRAGSGSGPVAGSSSMPPPSSSRRRGGGGDPLAVRLLVRELSAWVGSAARGAGALEALQVPVGLDAVAKVCVSLGFFPRRSAASGATAGSLATGIAGPSAGYGQQEEDNGNFDDTDDDDVEEPSDAKERQRDGEALAEVWAAAGEAAQDGRRGAGAGKDGREDDERKDEDGEGEGVVSEVPAWALALVLAGVVASGARLGQVAHAGAQLDAEAGVLGLLPGRSTKGKGKGKGAGRRVRRGLGNKGARGSLLPLDRRAAMSVMSGGEPGPGKGGGESPRSRSSRGSVEERDQEHGTEAGDSDSDSVRLRDIVAPELPEAVKRRLYASRLARGRYGRPGGAGSGRQGGLTVHAGPGGGGSTGPAPEERDPSDPEHERQLTFEPMLCRRSLEMADRATARVAEGVPRALLLMRYQQEVDERLEEQRRQKIAQEMAACTFRPATNAGAGAGAAPAGAGGGSLPPGGGPEARFERLHELHEQKLAKQQRLLAAKRAKAAEEEVEECTFQPLTASAIGRQGAGAGGLVGGDESMALALRAAQQARPRGLQTHRRRMEKARVQLRPPGESEKQLQAIAQVARGQDGLTRVSPFKLGTDRRASLRRTREQEGGGSGEQGGGWGAEGAGRGTSGVQARRGDGGMRAGDGAQETLGIGSAAGPAEGEAEAGGDTLDESPTVIVDLVLGEGEEGVERVVLTRRSDLDAVSAALGRKHGLQPALVGALRSALGREQAKAWEV